MQVEAALIQQTMTSSGSDGVPKTGALENEVRSWQRLFGPNLRRRTLIGVMMMFFQRMISDRGSDVHLRIMQNGVASTRYCTTARP